MNIKEACVSVFSNWNNFSGRACRSEFWYFCLAVFIVSFLISFFETMLFLSIESYPTLLTYGIEIRDKEWESVQNPIGPLTLIFNSSIKLLASQDAYLEYIDVWDSMLSEDGSRMPELFIEDGLHMNKKGYKVWTKQVRKSLSKDFNI